MDFDREYQKRRQPGDLDDFTDSNVQALVEGRRKKALPRPNVESVKPRGFEALDERHVIREMRRIAKGEDR